MCYNNYYRLQGSRVTLVDRFCKIKNRGVAQLVARDVWDVDAAGSNPVAPTIWLWEAIPEAFFFVSPDAIFEG